MITEKLNRPNYSYVKFATDGQAFGYAELICDTVSNIASLPTSRAEIAVGSKCLCLENGKTYVLSNHREWALPSDYTPGSGGASVDVPRPVEEGASESPDDLGSC